MSSQGQWRLFWGVAVVVAVFAALLPAAASADYEQVPEHFGASGEAKQLTGSVGVAVNASGKGGVEPGSFYVVGFNGRVVRFGPGSEGEEPHFREAWGWAILEGGSEGYERCGPAVEEELGEAAHCKPARSRASFPGEEPGHFGALSAVAIDQATGYVYVLSYVSFGHRENNLIQVFTAAGTPVTGFGDAGRQTPSPPESIDEGPEKLHQMNALGGALAVDEAGTVYVNDADYSGAANQHSRVMSFEPCATGIYDNYCYAGQEHDIASATPFFRLALSSSDQLVAANREEIRSYRLDEEHQAPLCSLSVNGNLEGLTANPETGEVFYTTQSDHSLHRLGPCDPESETYEELQSAVELEPQADEVWALAIDPSRSWGASRPSGVLYGSSYGSSGYLATGYIAAPARTFPPLVESESVAHTTTVSTTLRGLVNPNGFVTAYRFQYLTASTYAAQKAAAEGEGESGEELEDAAFAGASEAPAAPGTLPAGEPATAAASVAGLAPDTSYRFRIVTTSSCEGAEAQPCRATGLAAGFSTYPVSLVVPPDGRGYELVSPAQKNGGEVFPARPGLSSCAGECKPPGQTSGTVFPMQSSPAGDAVSYMGYSFSSTEGAAVYNSYVSRRNGAGWQTTAMSPQLLATKDGSDLAFDSRLDRGTIFQNGAYPQLAPGAPAGQSNLYLQATADPTALTPLLTHSSLRGRGLAVEYAGASADFSRQFFTANDALTGATAYAPAAPDPGTAGRELYEWHEGELALVNVLPGNTGVAPGASFAAVSVSSSDAYGISSDGSRVYFEDGSGQLYVREIGKLTREIHDPGHFVAASADGLRVLLSDGCLYSLAAASCVDLTQGQGGFQGIAGASGDFSKVYFVDKAALAPGSEAGICETVNTGGTAKDEEDEGRVPPGYGCNLYLYEPGAGTRFVATLFATDGRGGTLRLHDWGAEPFFQNTAEASPGGRYLAFGSTARLTGYDNVGPCERVGSTGEGFTTKAAPCKEVFLYDSATGSLTCPSCNPTGEAPRGTSTMPVIEGGGRPWLPQPRYLTDQGRLFFDTQDRLSPRDVNGNVEDVYEYEPAGLGSCTDGQGCVGLISPGTGTTDSNFLAADESGANVFFTSRDRLAPSDTDQQIDLYDARIGGGFPSELEAKPAECQGEACQPVSSPPRELAPASSLFNGGGNVVERQARKCPKGKVKRHGRCVKKHGRHHKKHTRHAKKRGERKHRAGSYRRTRR